MFLGKPCDVIHRTATDSDNNSPTFQPDRLGHFWDEIQVGDKVTDYPNNPFVVTEDMVMQFAALTGDLNPIHVDPDFASRSVHRGLVPHGALLASLTIGRYHHSGYTYGTTIAMMGMDVNFLARGSFGKRVYAEFEVTDKEGEPHPKRGRAALRAWLRDYETHEPLLELKLDMLVRRDRGKSARARVIRDSSEQPANDSHRNDGGDSIPVLREQESSQSPRP